MASKIFERLFKRLCRLAVYAALATGLTAGVADFYHFKSPSFVTCLWSLLLVEILGQIWRGGLGQVFDE